MTAQPAGPARVLIVEDEMLVRIFAVDALEEAGFQVVEAGDAAEALAALAQHPALAASVIDMGLPDRSGDQLAAHIRRERPDLPIVIASGRSERELKEGFAADRRIAILGKPYTAAMLVEALASLGIAAAR